MGSTEFQTISTICISSLAAVTIAWIWRKKFREGARRMKPTKWVKVGNLKKLTVYPIKSCQGIDAKEAVLTQLGLRCPNSKIRDRDFLLVDGEWKQLTMVNFPKLSLVKVEIDEFDRLTLSAPNTIPITFDCPKPNGKNECTCKIKKDTNMKALDCGDNVATWFRNYLGDEHVRLVFHHLDKTQRTFQPFMYECPQFGVSDLGTWHNATAYLLVAQESIAELNTRLAKKSTWKNFRPTMLIDGVIEPFGEINWSFVKIGDDSNAVLNVAAPCHRCPITTVDQEEGILTGDGEPLKTLRNMKINEQVVDDRLKEVLKNKGVMGLRLGLHLAAEEGAIIKVGDPVYAALL